MTVLFVALLLSAAVGSCVLLLLVVRARNKRRLFATMRGISCDAPGTIGISVVCSGVHDLEQIENLLSVEYTRYEVIVVLDGSRYPAEFRALVTRYKMIGVEYTPSFDLPARGVRSLGRSRKRNYRRLVLIDREWDGEAGDFDAAVGVATCDFLLPVLEGQYLLHDAIERLVAEVGPAGSEHLLAVRSWVGEPLTLVSREAVVFVGGFAHHPVQSVPWRYRRSLWEPFFRLPRQARSNDSWRLFGAMMLAVVVGVGVLTGLWYLTALFLTVALVWGAERCIALALSDVAGPCLGGVVAWRRHLSKLRVKNFTIS